MQILGLLATSAVGMPFPAAQPTGGQNQEVADDNAAESELLFFLREVEATHAKVMTRTNECLAEMAKMREVIVKYKSEHSGEVHPELQAAEQSLQAEIQRRAIQLTKMYTADPRLGGLIANFRPSHKFPGAVLFLARLQDAMDPSFGPDGKLLPGCLPEGCIPISMGGIEIVVPESWKPYISDLQQFVRQHATSMPLDLRYQWSRFDSARGPRSRVGIFLEQLETILRKLATVRRPDELQYIYPTESEKPFAGVRYKVESGRDEDWDVPFCTAAVCNGLFVNDNRKVPQLMTRMQFRSLLDEARRMWTADGKWKQSEIDASAAA